MGTEVVGGGLEGGGIGGGNDQEGLLTPRACGLQGRGAGNGIGGKARLGSARVDGGDGGR